MREGGKEREKRVREQKERGWRERGRRMRLEERGSKRDKEGWEEERDLPAYYF